MSKSEKVRQLPAALVSWWRALISPPPDETVCEWAFRAIDLSDESAEKGSFKVQRRPYMREPLERHRDARCRVLTLCWGSQLGKTIVVYVGRFFRNRVYGYSCLIVLPSIKYAQRIAKSRILPMLRKSLVMKDIIQPVRHSITALAQYFTTCQNFVTGSNSPTELAGSPLPDTAADETDKFDEGDEDETSATNLIPQRSKTFPYSLAVWTSTPSKPKGFIWKSLHAGDHRRFMLWCPRCGKHHALALEQFRYPQDAKKKNGKWDFDRIEEEAWHECPHGCGYQFREPDKHRAYSADWTASKRFPKRLTWFDTEESFEAELARLGPDMMRETYPVFWLPTNDDGAKGHASYHLPSWYSPDSKCTIGAVVAQKLRAETSGSMQDIQDFFNQTGAEAFDVVLYGVSNITDLPKGSYELLDPWEEAMIHGTSGKPVRFLSADRQQASFWVSVRTLGADGSTRLFWCGEVATFDEVDAKAAELGVQTILCDCSYKMKETLDECHRRNWIPMRGEDKQAYLELEAPSAQFPKGRTVHKIWRWATYISASGYRVQTLCHAKQGGQSQLAALIANKTGVRWDICATPPDFYTQQMSCMTYAVAKGKEAWTKKDPKAPDHIWDCETQLAVWIEVLDVIPKEEAKA